MEISVRMLDGELLPVEIGEQWDEKRLKQEVGCDTEEHKVEFEGEVLKDGQIISDLGLQEGDVITITASQEVQEKVRFEMSGLPTGLDGLARIDQALREDDVGTFMAYYSDGRCLKQLQHHTFNAALLAGSRGIVDTLLEYDPSNCVNREVLTTAAKGGRFDLIKPLITLGAWGDFISVLKYISEPVDEPQLMEAARAMLSNSKCMDPDYASYFFTVITGCPHTWFLIDIFLSHLAIIKNESLLRLLSFGCASKVRDILAGRKPAIKVLWNNTTGFCSEIYSMLNKGWADEDDDVFCRVIGNTWPIVGRKLRTIIMRTLLNDNKICCLVRLLSWYTCYNWSAICTEVAPPVLDQLLTSKAIKLNSKIVGVFCDDARVGFPMNASLKIVLKHDASLSRVKFYAGGSPLSVLARRNNVDGMKLFLEHGADLHHVTPYGNSCLQAAIASCAGDAIHYLRSLGMDDTSEVTKARNERAARVKDNRWK